MNKGSDSDSVEWLKQVTVASPCPARSENMNGDGRVRFWDQCRKNVYNLPSMTSAEAQALVKEKEGNLCARFYRRADGTMLTTDCPVGIERIGHRIRTAVQTSEPPPVEAPKADSKPRR